MLARKLHRHVDPTTANQCRSACSEGVGATCDAKPSLSASREATSQENALPWQTQFDARHGGKWRAIRGLQAAVEVHRHGRKLFSGQYQGRELPVKRDDQSPVLSALALGESDKEQAENQQGQRRQAGDAIFAAPAQASHPYLENLKLQ
jgi:hypothetical protein